MAIVPQFALYLTHYLTHCLTLAALAIAVAAIPMSWRAERMNEPDGGGKRCEVVSLGGDVVARLALGPGEKTAAWTVLVGVDNRPGSLRYLRVNRKIFQTSEPSFRGAAAADIVARLKAPGEFAFEWFTDPGAAKRAGLYGVGDFAGKAADCEVWILGTRV